VKKQDDISVQENENLIQFLNERRFRNICNLYLVLFGAHIMNNLMKKIFFVLQAVFVLFIFNEAIAVQNENSTTNVILNFNLQLDSSTYIETSKDGLNIKVNNPEDNPIVEGAAAKQKAIISKKSRSAGNAKKSSRKPKKKSIVKKPAYMESAAVPEIVMYQSGYVEFSSKNYNVLWHPTILLEFQNTSKKITKSSKVRVVFFLHRKKIGESEKTIAEILPNRTIQEYLSCHMGAKSKTFIENENLKIWCKIYVDNTLYFSAAIHNAELDCQLI
jgi:hypothetical protein